MTLEKAKETVKSEKEKLENLLKVQKLDFEDKLKLEKLVFCLAVLELIKEEL